MPKITVGMPVYNGEKFLEESIRSVLAQTYDDFVFLIADNGSTDRSTEICADYAAQDNRIRYWRNDRNIGAAANYNALFHNAETPYFRWSNADDLLDPRLHEMCLKSIEEDPDAVLTAGTTRFIDADGNKLELYDDNLEILDNLASERLRTFFNNVGLTNVIYGLMRTEALRKTDLMGDGTIPAADKIMMGQLTMQGKFRRIDEVLFFRRLHEDSSSADRTSDDFQENFWSAGNRKFRKPALRRITAYWRSISRTSAGPSERLSLYRLILGQAWARKREILRDIVQFAPGR